MKRPRMDRALRLLAGALLGALAFASAAAAALPALRAIPAAARVAEFCRAAVLAGFAPLAPVREHLALIPIGLLALGSAVAVWDRARQQLRLRRFLRSSPSRALKADDPIYPAAAGTGVAHRVLILEGAAAAGPFTTGLLRPRIYFADELQRALDPLELEAAFQHELVHLRRRDPLRLAVIRFGERLLFWLPLARPLADAAADALELRADDVAGSRAPLELASAIVKTARLARAPVPAAVPALGHARAAHRARRLLGEPLPRPRLPLAKLTLTALLLSMVWASALLAGERVRHDGKPPCNICLIRQLAQQIGIGS
ncbi:MAG: M56 family metallopeptidase [Gemmatimonadetes bacterium]|nr:M56 family metallopeptidase [Gemmatimonadota bacterium]